MKFDFFNVCCSIRELRLERVTASTVLSVYKMYDSVRFPSTGDAINDSTNGTRQEGERKRFQRLFNFASTIWLQFALFDCQQFAFQMPLELLIFVVLVIQSWILIVFGKAIQSYHITLRPMHSYLVVLLIVQTKCVEQQNERTTLRRLGCLPFLVTLHNQLDVFIPISTFDFWQACDSTNCI